MSTRRVLFYTATVSLLLGCAAWGMLDRLHAPVIYRIIGFTLLLPIGLAVTLLWPQAQSRRVQVCGLLVLALSARLLLLPYPPDSDSNRYLWEGRLIREGESPYAHVAASPEWEHLRDAYWSGMNQRELRTIYPPLAQWLFAAAGALWYHPVALKLMFIGFDLGVVALLLAMLSARSLPSRLAGLYAFNPVPLVGFAGEAHFDAMLLFFTLLAVWLRERRHVAWSWIALGLAVQIKLVAIVLAPLFLRGGGWRKAWIGALAIALPFLPYLGDLGRWLEGVRHFGAELGFNGSIHALAWLYFDDRRAAGLLCGVLLLVWAVAVALRRDDVARGAFWIFGGLIVLSPIVHYWYVSWALIFLPLFPSLAWLWLSGAMALYFLVSSEVLAGRAWGLPPWAQIVIWATFALLLLREIPAALRPPLRRKERPAVRTLAVVIPTLNEGGTLPRCLDSLSRMLPPADEVIVVDGGSTDATPETAVQRGATVLLTERGRGRQIAAGVSAARSDAVLVMHADCTVERDTSRRVVGALNANLAAFGGAVGQRFDADSFKLCTIELLNEIRALFFGMSFGEQAQFFRRVELEAAGGFPRLPLMEDVEFSLRARALGPVLYLGGGIVSSARRWRTEHWFKRSITVVSMTLLYLVRRRNAAQVAAALYQKYYQADSPVGAPVP